MNPDIERVEALFNRALEFRPEERTAFLAGACAQDAPLLARVQALLQAHEASDEILPEQPHRETAAGMLAERPGDRIGHYKLLEQIGEGGWGVVYMAEQEQPVRRRVALKIIKLGMDTKRVVARFEAERQALALMDHPNIAKVFDAGTTPTGRPYFVMELVRGVRITDYCDENDLPAAQRLDLVTQVCRAIQHAHQKGIVHRDIKPSNVLVSVHDGVPVPKVIDFGIAKATEGRLTDQTLFTSFEQFIGTPAYMSPEQAQLKGLDVDTRTDIYSLGVLLYELLTGKTPFDAKELLSAGLDEMRRTIREKEPLRPSTRLTMELAEAAPEQPQEGASSQETGTERGSRDRLQRKKELIQMLRGDLDWIVMKCLEKDRARRYETANGLAMDLQRHLKGEPVVARPPSNLYRFQKLVRRNKLLFAAAAAVAFALVLGIVGSTWEAIRAVQAERVQARLREDADRAREGEVQQRAVAERHLYEALLGEARAKQLSGRAGQRFESLQAIEKAAAIHASKELSDAAVAAFGLPDLREQKSWQFPAHWVAENVCFDDSFSLYAFRTLSGITVRRIQDDEKVTLLPVKDVSDIPDGLALRCFDPQSHYLAAKCLTREGPRCRVWDLTRGGALVLNLACAGNPDFSPDGRALAVVNPDKSISVTEIESGKERKRFRVDGSLDVLRFSPNGAKLAGLAIGGMTVRIWELASGQVVTTLPFHGSVTFLAWSQDGALLAVGQQDGRIGVWDVQSGRLQAHMEGHENRVTALAFSHQGDLLASASWDSTLRLWDAASGQQLVVYRTQDTQLHFSADDRTLACAVEGETCGLLEVAHSSGCRRFVGRGEARRSWSGDFSLDGRLMAVGTSNGIAFWDMIMGNQIGFLATADCRSVYFKTNSGLSVVASTAEGVYSWPLQIQSTAGGSFLRVGPPETLAGREPFGSLALDHRGMKIVVVSRKAVDPLVLDMASPTNVLRLRGHPGPGVVAVEPSGRWAAAGTWKGAGVKVYDTSTGQLLCELPVKRSAFVAFSPDANWLATADTSELRLWKTGTWEPWPNTVPGDRVSENNPLAFSPDGSLLAAVHAAYEIQLISVPACEVIATLRAPTIAHLGSLSFNPDGTKLAAIEWSGQIDVWDLRFIRQELQKLNLDWELPPLPSASQAPPPGPAVLQLDAGPFSKQELAQAIPAREANASSNLIDLTDYYNAPLTQSWHSPVEKHNDLSELPQGLQRFAGVEFDVRGLIQIGARAANGLAYPNYVRAIPVQRQCRRLHLLHAAIFSGGAHPGDQLGSYICHYIDGRQAELRILAGKDLADWWSLPAEQDGSAVIAWTGNNPAARASGHTLRLFKTEWVNRFPDVPISQVDFVSEQPGSGAPFLVALTVEP